MIRGTGFLFYWYFGMGLFETVIQKSDVADDAKAICNNLDFIGIAEMLVDIELLDFGIGRRMGGHGSIGNFVWIIGIVKAFEFGISF